MTHPEEIPTAGFGTNAPAARAWTEKLDFLLHEEAITANPAQRFELKQQIEECRARLRECPAAQPANPAPGPGQPRIPMPPDLYAEPPYIGRDQFVGRQAELAALDDWAQPADPHNLLLFDAIGGNGKSMLTWHWINRQAPGGRGDWAGRFWYSFYERGAVMADFCRRALAYMTRRPLAELNKLPTRELAHDLLAELHARPWLLVLDGLERVLVAYHRIDAAEVSDEEANAPTDRILSRNPCATIRDEDGAGQSGCKVFQPSQCRAGPGPSGSRRACQPVGADRPEVTAKQWHQWTRKPWSVGRFRRAGQRCLS